MRISNINFKECLLYFFVTSILLVFLLIPIGNFTFDTIISNATILHWEINFIKQWPPILIALMLWIFIIIFFYIFMSANKISYNRNENRVNKQTSSRGRFFGRKYLLKRIVCFVIFLICFYGVCYSLTTGQICRGGRGGCAQYISYADNPINFIAAFILNFDITIGAFLIFIFPRILRPE
jgi:hypothetical protein